MKKLITAMFIVVVAFNSIAAQADDFHPEADATLEKDHFWADVNFRSGSSAIVTSFRAWYNASPEKVFETLVDTNALAVNHRNYNDAAALSAATFQSIVDANPKDIDAVKPLIKKIPTSQNRKIGGRWTNYEYLNLEFPWPLANRWTIQKASVDESRASQGVYRYDYTMSVGNFKALTGYWEVVPVPGKEGWSEFRGRYESDPGVGLPKFITKSAAKSGLKRDVEDNRRVIASK